MKRIVLLLAVVLFVVGCAPSQSISTPSESLMPSSTPIPSKTLNPALTPTSTHTPTLTVTPKPTFTPSATSTPRPALVEHEWYPDQILVYDGVEPGIGYTFPKTPNLILYADGRIFMTNEIQVNDGYSTYREQVFFKTLDRQGVCKILNTFDQIGYLDYDPKEYYLEPRVYGVDDAGSSIFNVNAWKSTTGKYYALGVHLYLERRNDESYYGEPWISPALRDAYRFLTYFPHNDFEIYNPDELLIWVYSLPDFHDESLSKKWPLQNPSLAELHKRTGASESQPGDDYVILTGNEAQIIFDYFGGNYDWQGELVLENGITYIVFARPLLPYENPHLYVSEFPSPDSPKPNFKLSCYPSDGVMPIPTPPNP